jgi:hypothetical protein
MPHPARIFGFIVLALAMALTAGVARAQELDTQPALDAGDAWLALVDSGRYGESWDAAAENFKEAIGRVKWEVAVQEARDKVGGAAKRKLRAARSAIDLPNSPKGEYVVIEYETRFPMRPLATETVTLMKQKDGRWRVAGYFIH